MTAREQYAPGPAGGAQFRRFWSERVDALERHLDHTNQSTPTKKKSKKKTTRPKPRMQ